MTRRYRLPSRHLSGVINRVALNEIVEPTTNGAWAEKALGEEATRVRGLALSVADAAVFAVAQVFAGHGLLDDVFDTRDNDALYGVISRIAVRLIHERLIERLGEVRHDGVVRKQASISILVREYQEYGR